MARIILDFLNMKIHLCEAVFLESVYHTNQAYSTDNVSSGYTSVVMN